MEFTVPQFIEREPKLMGPFTFKQFLYLAVPGAIAFVLRFTIGKKNFPLFIIITVILVGLGLALGFVKIKGYTLPVFFKNFFLFSVGPKIFLWRRKVMPPRFQKVVKMEKGRTEEETSLRVSARSHLQQLSTHVETKK
jgi:hypothetical protein